MLPVFFPAADSFLEDGGFFLRFPAAGTTFFEQFVNEQACFFVETGL